MAALGVLLALWNAWPIPGHVQCLLQINDPFFFTKFHLVFITYPRLNDLKTLPWRVAHTFKVCIWLCCPLPPRRSIYFLEMTVVLRYNSRAVIKSRGLGISRLL